MFVSYMESRLKPKDRRLHGAYGGRRRRLAGRRPEEGSGVPGQSTLHIHIKMS